MTDRAELQRRFTYHPPANDATKAAYEVVRRQALEFAVLVDGSTPDSREKALALTKLEEAVMWANAAIARNGLL